MEKYCMQSAVMAYFASARTADLVSIPFLARFLGDCHTTFRVLLSLSQHLSPPYKTFGSIDTAPCEDAGAGVRILQLVEKVLMELMEHLDLMELTENLDVLGLMETLHLMELLESVPCLFSVLDCWWGPWWSPIPALE